jgi:hypothetical protein
VPFAVIEVGLALMIEFAAFADAGLTVSTCVAEVMVVGDVLAAVMVGVPAFVSV